jgi:hypothetical protein
MKKLNITAIAEQVEEMGYSFVSDLTVNEILSLIQILKCKYKLETEYDSNTEKIRLA